MSSRDGEPRSTRTSVRGQSARGCQKVKLTWDQSVSRDTLTTTRHWDCYWPDRDTTGQENPSQSLQRLLLSRVCLSTSLSSTPRAGSPWPGSPGTRRSTASGCTSRRRWRFTEDRSRRRPAPPPWWPRSRTCCRSRWPRCRARCQVPGVAWWGPCPSSSQSRQSRTSRPLQPSPRHRPPSPWPGPGWGSGSSPGSPSDSPSPGSSLRRKHREVDWRHSSINRPRVSAAVAAAVSVSVPARAVPVAQVASAVRAVRAVRVVRAVLEFQSDVRALRARHLSEFIIQSWGEL